MGQVARETKSTSQPPNKTAAPRLTVHERKRMKDNLEMTLYTKAKENAKKGTSEKVVDQHVKQVEAVAKTVSKDVTTQKE